MAEPARSPFAHHRDRALARHCRWTLVLLSVGCVSSTGLNADPARYDISRLQSELTDLRQAWQHSNRTYEARIAELEQRLGALEAPAAAGDTDGARLSHESETDDALVVRLSTMVAGGGSDQSDEELQWLQAGSHDPNRNGFTVQLVGLAFRAPLGPYASSRASLTSRIDPEGESKTELEEAYLVARGPESALEFKAGHYFTEFGFLNPRHADDWAFVDKPVMLTRLFGSDALRNPGVQVAWNTHAAGTARAVVGVQHPSGETAHSFLSAAGEEIGPHVLIDREVEDLADLLYSARLAYGWTTASGAAWRLGTSGLWGPNASAADTRTAIYGIDFGASWPGAQTDGQHVDWNSELLWRRYEAGGGAASEVLRDWGGYTQAVWRFRPDWQAGVRFEYANGNGDDRRDPFRDRRTRTSLQLGWLGWRNASVRLQYNRDRAGHLDEGRANSIWLQLRYELGGDEQHGH